MMPGTALPFDFNRESLMADASGALYWPDQKTLVVADLHLEKGSAYARNGSHLPNRSMCPRISSSARSGSFLARRSLAWLRATSQKWMLMPPMIAEKIMRVPRP